MIIAYLFTFKLKSIIHGFANKVRQSYRGEFNFV